MKAARKQMECEEEVLNQFLSNLKETSVADMFILTEAFDTYMRKKSEEHRVMEDLVNSIYKECKMNINFFSFYDVPDLLVKKKFQKQNLKNAIQLLNRTKEAYLDGKAVALGKAKEELTVNDEDLVRLELLREQLELRETETEKEKSFLIDYIRECQKRIADKIKELQVENDKIKKVIETNVVINYLNETIDERHASVFLIQHKLKLLPLVLSKHQFRTAKEVRQKFEEVANMTEKNNMEVKQRLD